MAKKKKDTVSVLDVIQGLSQAAANAYDGAHNEDGDLREIGLRREEGNPLLDERVMDGFGVKFMGPILCINYQTQVKLKEIYGGKFENEMNQTMGDISSFLKKEYRKITGKSVSLTKDGEIDVRVESANRRYTWATIRVENSTRIRSWATAYQMYKIGGIDDVMLVGEDSKNRLDKSWKSFLDQGGWKGKRPKNDTRPKGETK